jgi:RimJ/RimL family protein N-acetyltransferase
MRIRFRPNRTLAAELETERFHLHPMGLLEAIRVTDCWRTDPDLLRGILLSARPKSRIAWLKKAPLPDNVDSFAFAIVPKGESAPIGVHTIRLHSYRSARNLVGIHDRGWWGKGVVVEVRAKLMNHFYRHGVERFCGTVDARNVASIFNYRRLGYDHTGTRHRDEFDPLTGEVIDLLMFEMFRDKWAAGPFAEPDLK